MKPTSAAKRKPILTPTYFLAAIVAMVALHFLVPHDQVIASPFIYAGALPLLVGIGMNVWASQVFDTAKTTVKPFEKSSCLVTDGLFRYSRHPMYLGMVLILAGIAILLGSLAPVAVIPAFAWVMDRRFIAIEERNLEAVFGDEYREYKKRVRRWI